MSEFHEPSEAAQEALGGLPRADAPESGARAAEAAGELAAWEARLEHAIGALCSFLAGVDPCWETKDAEVRSLAKAWAPVAAEASGGAEIPPLYVALGATALWAVPRTITTLRNRREASQGDALPGGTGEWEDDPDEGAAPLDAGLADPLGSER